MQENDDLLLSQLSDEQIRDIAERIGVSEQEARSAIAAAIPTLIGGLDRAAESSPDNQQFASKIQGIGSLGGNDIFGNLPAPKSTSLDDALGPGNQLPRSQTSPPPFGREVPPEQFPAKDGGLLDEIFGGRKKRVEDAIGRSSGIDLRKIGPLLMILAPIVLGALQSKARASSGRSGGTGIDPNDFRDVLKSERRKVESKSGGSLLGQLLDQDGDGDFDFSDILKIGMRFLSGGRR